MQKRREAWILGGLVLLFVVATAVFTQRKLENEQKEQPTSYSAGKAGTKAAFRLLEQVGFQPRRWERPLTALPKEAGLLVVVEPFFRERSAAEAEALQEWLNDGGTLLLVVSVDWALRSLSGLNFEEAEVEREFPAAADLPLLKKSRYGQDVSLVHVDGPTRLKVKKPAKVETLVKDSQGAFLVTWPEEQGRVVLAADGLAFNNHQVSGADNAILLANIAQAHTSKTRPLILFDEYHQGYGAEEHDERGLWQVIGSAGQMLFWYSLAAALLLVYNANRRFGTAKEIKHPEFRSSTEYISSMAGLYRRAEAGEIALETIYHGFLRDLAKRVDAPPNATVERLAALAATRFGWDAASVSALLERCRQFVEAAPAPKSGRAARKAKEAELVALASGIENYRRMAEMNRTTAAS